MVETRGRLRDGDHETQIEEQLERGRRTGGFRWIARTHGSSPRLARQAVAGRWSGGRHVPVVGQRRCRVHRCELGWRMSDLTGLRAIVAYKSIRGGATADGGAVARCAVATGVAGVAETRTPRGCCGSTPRRAGPQARGPAGAGSSAAELAVGRRRSRAGRLTDALEAWALRRGRPWGAWLVVGATGALLPFEIFTRSRVCHACHASPFFALNLLHLCLSGARRVARAAARRS